MNRFIYCLYDKVSRQYLPVFEAKNMQDAVRMLKRSQNEPNFMVDDYALAVLAEMRVTEFEDESVSEFKMLVGDHYNSMIDLRQLLGENKEKSDGKA